jgi:hypothetical protein
VAAEKSAIDKIDSESIENVMDSRAGAHEGLSMV